MENIWLIWIITGIVLVIGATVGGIIGGLVGFSINRKVIRKTDDLLAQIEELQKEPL